MLPGKIILTIMIRKMKDIVKMYFCQCDFLDWGDSSVSDPVVRSAASFSKTGHSLPGRVPLKPGNPLSGELLTFTTNHRTIEQSSNSTI